MLALAVGSPRNLLAAALRVLRDQVPTTSMPVGGGPPRAAPASATGGPAAGDMTSGGGRAPAGSGGASAATAVSGGLAEGRGPWSSLRPRSRQRAPASGTVREKEGSIFNKDN